MKVAESKDLNKWRGLSYCWIGGHSIVKMVVFPILIYRVNAILVNIPEEFVFVEVDKLILKFI